MTNTIKQIGKEVNKDISRLVRTIGKELKEIGIESSKYITYPLIGNLSKELRKKLEDKFDCKSNWSNWVAGTSELANIALYPLITYGLTENPTCALYSGIYGIIEGITRVIQSEKKLDHSASIPGKLISIPIEYGLNVYKRAKQNQEEKIK